MTTRFGIGYIDRIWFQASAGASPCFFYLEPTKMSASFSRKLHVLQLSNSQRHLSLHANFTSDQIVKHSHKRCMLYSRACHREQRNHKCEGGFPDLDSGSSGTGPSKNRDIKPAFMCIFGPLWHLPCASASKCRYHVLQLCCAELFPQIEGLNASGSSTYQNWRSVSESASP